MPPDAEFTAADLEPYLRGKPAAPIAVNLGGMLLTVDGVYYDNEYGLHVLELDPDEVATTLRLLRPGA